MESSSAETSSWAPESAPFLFEDCLPIPSAHHFAPNVENIPETLLAPTKASPLEIRASMPTDDAGNVRSGACIDGHQVPSTLSTIHGQANRKLGNVVQCAAHAEFKEFRNEVLVKCCGADACDLIGGLYSKPLSFQSKWPSQVNVRTKVQPQWSSEHHASCTGPPNGPLSHAPASPRAHVAEVWPEIECEAVQPRQEASFCWFCGGRIRCSFLYCVNCGCKLRH